MVLKIEQKLDTLVLSNLGCDYCGIIEAAIKYLVTKGSKSCIRLITKLFQMVYSYSILCFLFLLG